MMSAIKTQSNMKDGEVKKVVEEKNKQIELLKKSEREKEKMNQELMHKFEYERRAQAQEMQDLVSQLAQQ